MSVSDLPEFNAFLNLTSGVFVTLGIYFIKTNRQEAHKICMISAFSVSVLFLISYLVYHFQVGSIRFQGEGWLRTVYFSILLSHTILAVIIVPLILRTLYLAWRKRFDRHIRIAKWTFPLWLYVSVTGVVVYLMLYRLPLSP